MPTRFLKTEAGIFRVTIDEEFKHEKNTRSNPAIGKSLRIEGRNICAYVSLPNGSHVGYFGNIKTCEANVDKQEKLLRGHNATTMVNLMCTIIQEIAPDIQRLEFEDSSTLQLGNEQRVPLELSLPIYELACTQSTWYERVFGARLLTEEAHHIYLKAKEGLYSKKPDNFSFHNKDLDDLLRPIYISTHTWEEFFQQVNTLQKKHRICFTWLKQAVSSAMGGLGFHGQQWKLDLYGNERIYKVDYKEVRARKKAFMNSYEETYRMKFLRTDMKQGRVSGVEEGQHTQKYIFKHKDSLC